MADELWRVDATELMLVFVDTAGPRSIGPSADHDRPPVLTAMCAGLVGTT